MFSRATFYRRRNILQNGNTIKKNSYPSNTAERNLSNNVGEVSLTNKGPTRRDDNTTTVTTTTIAIPDATPTDVHLIDDHLINRRSCPTTCDIAAAAMIFKVRRLQNNQNVDFMCQLLTALNVKNVPVTMKSIERHLHPTFNLKEYYKSYYICSGCGTSNINNTKTCQCDNDSNLVEFYLYSIKQQIQQILLIKGIYSKLKREKVENMRLFADTTYGEILKQIENNAFTMIINCDGVCTPNKNLSLWPFIFMVNEIPIPERRYMENVLIAGVIPATSKPTNIIFQTCLTLIRDDLLQLESGQWFYVNDLNQRILIHFYTVASCTDKPAEALMENMVSHNSEYGCPKCFCKGELYHGVRGEGIRRKTFTIRVYPFAHYKLRSQDLCSKIIEDNYIINGSNGKSNSKTQVTNSSKKGNEELRNCFGHLGDCPLTKLKYMNYGKSFLTDSLHTIYAGAFKKLMELLFDRRYRKEDWSLFKKLNHIDEALSYVKVPSTTQRRFRSIKKLNKFKASEYRTLCHFGIPIITRYTSKQIQTLLLCFLTAINLASPDYITVEIIHLVEELLYYFVEQFQNTFGLRHMNSNVHSLLHIADSLRHIGPLWMYSTFNYEGIDKDLIKTLHGTVQFAKQLIRQNILFRDAIVHHRTLSYPLLLFKFNEQLLSRKPRLVRNQDVIDECILPKPVSSDLYDHNDNGIATIAQSYFDSPLTFFHSVKISNVILKTTTISYGKIFSDSCISFYFSGKQKKIGLIRAIVKSKQDNVRLLIEELIEKKLDSSKIKFKLNNKLIQVPNIFNLNRSNIYHVKHPKWIIKKHAMIFRPGNYVTVLEYPNLKDNS